MLEDSGVKCHICKTGTIKAEVGLVHRQKTPRGFFRESEFAPSILGIETLFCSDCGVTFHFIPGHQGIIDEILKRAQEDPQYSGLNFRSQSL